MSELKTRGRVGRGDRGGGDVVGRWCGDGGIGDGGERGVVEADDDDIGGLSRGKLE